MHLDTMPNWLHIHFGSLFLPIDCDYRNMRESKTISRPLFQSSTPFQIMLLCWRVVSLLQVFHFVTVFGLVKWYIQLPMWVPKHHFGPTFAWYIFPDLSLPVWLVHGVYFSFDDAFSLMIPLDVISINVKASEWIKEFFQGQVYKRVIKSHVSSLF